MIYDYNIDNAAIQQLPPDKRLPKNITFIQELLNHTLQDAHYAFFNTYYQSDLSKRILYNGQKLVLENALNLKFGGVFRQPPLVSDIYTSKLSSVAQGFRIGLTEAHTSSVGISDSSDSIGLSYPFVYVNNFQINIPSALLALTTYQEIRNFVNIYIPLSINFTIVAI